jgi:hypothetical protein
MRIMDANGEAYLPLAEGIRKTARARVECQWQLTLRSEADRSTSDAAAKYLGKPTRAHGYIATSQVTLSVLSLLSTNWAIPLY